MWTCIGIGLQMPWQTFDGLEGRQVRHIGVNVRCEPGITVAHELLRQPLRNALLGELGGEGVAERIIHRIIWGIHPPPGGTTGMPPCGG